MLGLCICEVHLHCLSQQFFVFIYIKTLMWYSLQQIYTYTYIHTHTHTHTPIFFNLYTLN